MAETADERWRSCQSLGTIGPVLVRHPEQVDKVFDLLKDALQNDPSGIVRYHAVVSLGKLAPYYQRARRPELVFDIANLIIGAGLTDEYDRVRRGAFGAMWEVSNMHAKRPELAQKIREACAKALSSDLYDVVRMDAATLMGKLGPPAFLGAAALALMAPLEKAAAKNVAKAPINDKLVAMICKLAMYKLGTVKEGNFGIGKDVIVLERLVPAFDHWAYWPQRECLARALGQLGKVLAHTGFENLDKVLTLLETLAIDTVWDVRAAACKGLSDMVPATTGKGAGSRPTSATSVVSCTSVISYKGLGPELQKRAAPLLERTMKFDSSPEVRRAAQIAFAKYG